MSGPAVYKTTTRYAIKLHGTRSRLSLHACDTRESNEVLEPNKTIARNINRRDTYMMCRRRVCAARRCVLCLIDCQ